LAVCKADAEQGGGKRGMDAEGFAEAEDGQKSKNFSVLSIKLAE